MGPGLGGRAAEVGQERKSSRGRGRAGRFELRRAGPGSAVQFSGEAVVGDLDGLGSGGCRPVANRSQQSETGLRWVVQSVAAQGRRQPPRSRKSGGGVDRAGQVLGPGLGGSGRLVPGRCPGGGPRGAWVRPGPGVSLGPGVLACVRVRGSIRAGVGVGVVCTRGGACRVGAYGCGAHVPIRMCVGFDLVAIQHQFSFHFAGGLKSSVRINDRLPIQTRVETRPVAHPSGSRSVLDGVVAINRVLTGSPGVRAGPGGGCCAACLPGGR